MRNDTAPLVLAEAGNRKADHLCAAADSSRTACQQKALVRAAQSCGINGRLREDHGANGCGGDRQRQNDTNHHRDHDAHQQRLQRGCRRDEHAQIIHDVRDQRTQQPGCTKAAKDGDDRCDQHVYLGFLRDQHADLTCNDHGKERSRRTCGIEHAFACSLRGCPGKNLAVQDDRAHGICHGTHGSSREHDQRMRAQCICNGHADCHAGRALGVRCNRVQKRQMSIRSDRVKDGTDQERREKSQCHGPHSLDEIPVRVLLDGVCELILLQSNRLLSIFYTSSISYITSECKKNLL